MKQPFHSLKPHRVARIALWARTMLLWIALLLTSGLMRVNRRHVRQRCGFVSLTRMEVLIRALAMIRVGRFIPKRRARVQRSAAPSGFVRRVRRGGMMRASAGSRFRKALRSRDLLQRIHLLVSALADIDAFARRYLLARAVRGLTRICPVLLFAPPADAARSLAGSTPLAQDSS